VRAITTPTAPAPTVNGREKPSMPIRGCMSACPVERVMTAKMAAEAVRVATAMASS
jgi:hypothetical protein